MQKDLKIGMIVGGVVLAVGVLWFATRPNMSSPQSRLKEAQQSNPPGSGLWQDPNHQMPPSQQAQPSPQTSAAQASLPQAQGTTQWPQSPAPSAPAPAAPETKRIHVVQQGETLSDISEMYYNTPNQWKKIRQANRSQIPDPDHIRPGMKLVIPE